MLSQQEKHQYLHEIVIPDFMPLVSQKIYSVIYDYECKIAICTNYSAQSIAMESWKDTVGISFKDQHRFDLGAKIFGSKYTGVFVEFIHHYIDKIYQLQLSIFRNKNVVNFIDLLPYNDQFIAYLITYVPIFHPKGEVIGIQSFATSIPFFSHYDYLQNILGYSSEKTISKTDVKLTNREHEILFLLANLIPTEQMTQILGIRRSTISNIIAKQISKKFGLTGSNSKLLTQLAIEQGYHKLVPESLSKPYIIILDEKLAKEINQGKKAKKPLNKEALVRVIKD